MQSDTNGSPNKIGIIQSLRGVAALSVVTSHLWGIDDKIIIQPSLKKIARYGGHGVEVFFIISGFIILFSLDKQNYNLRNYFKFIFQRFCRLQPAYTISLLLCLCFGFIIVRHNQSVLNIYSAANLFSNFTYIVPFYRNGIWLSPVYWTLSVEFQFYVFIGLLAPLLIKKTTSKFLLHLILICFIAFSMFNKNLSLFITWLSFFSIGMACFLWTSKRFNHLDMLIQCLFTCLINCLIFFNFKFLFLICIIPVVIYFLRDKKTKFLYFTGQISYSLYLIHAIVGNSIIDYLSKTMDTKTVFMQILILIIAIAGSYFVSIICYFSFEKPFIKMFSNKKIIQRAA